ncbi:MAG TPA: ornithine cyclodeaminase family protein [Puia sp.]|nr:ornithine cyclodeaminase family protein [Puia sp.]
MLKRSEVAKLLTIEQCIPAVEQAFKLYFQGEAPTPVVLGIHAQNGGFHIKAGIMNLGRNYFVAKTNANFPENNKKNGLPTIQGIISVFDADNGRLLALMDSIEITLLRTGAATAVAAKWLAKGNAGTMTICGCGHQGEISLRAVMKVRRIEKVFVFDIDQLKAAQFAHDLSKELNISIQPVDHLNHALKQSDICITCTPSRKYFLLSEYIIPGTFIAAVGADSEDKQELDPSLVSGNKLITDITTQCAAFGELHHAIDRGYMKRSDEYAELGEIVAGKKPGRTSEEEIIIFDSTGTALQDIVSAAIVYEKALAKNGGMKLNFSE